MRGSCILTRKRDSFTQVCEYQPALAIKKKKRRKTMAKIERRACAFLLASFMNFSVIAVFSGERICRRA